jgi:L-fuculose-phosphate aldolase
MEDRVFDEFRRFGRELFIQGVNSSHSGNMSIREKGRILITRRGAMLGDLKPDDLILINKDGASEDASTLLHLHQKIYMHTDALAIVHAHPPYAIALSMMMGEITPLDLEGKVLFGKIPVIDERFLEEVLDSLRDYRAIILKGHGSIAVGKDLEEAFMFTSSLANVCKTVFLHNLIRKSTL